MNRLIRPLELKMDSGNARTFTAYGNVKNVKDHAGDVALDGCYTKSIDSAKERKDLPKILWGHNSFAPPVAVMKAIDEDSHGLIFEGKVFKNPRAEEVYEGAMEGAINKFSIGYIPNQERWNSEKDYNELIEIDVKEISFVNFACNEASLLQDIKSRFKDGELPDRRQLESSLRDIGYSRKEAVAVASCYFPDKNIDETELINLTKGLDLFSDKPNNDELAGFAKSLDLFK